MKAMISGKRLWAGTLLLLTGLFYLLYNLNALPFEVPAYVFTWQMALIITGVYFIYKSRFWGLLLISTGWYFILPLTGMIAPVDFQKLWPAGLILLGILVLFGSGFKKKKKQKELTAKKMNEINEGLFEITAIMGGDNRQISTYDFKGGKITVVMGGIELDLTNCHLTKDEPAIIEMDVVMGGISLKVSREWNIQSELMPIMSGIEDDDLRRLDVQVDPAALVIIRGTLVMGGIEIIRA